MLEIELTKRNLSRSVAMLVAFAAVGVAVNTVVAARHGGDTSAVSAEAGDDRPPADAIAVLVDPRQTHQTLLGFGAATAFYQNWIAGHPYKTEMYDALFKGLNLQILRLQNVYRGDPNQSLAHETDIVQGAQTSLGHPIQILMSAWAPPAAIKSNHDTKNGGTLTQENGVFAYDKYAQFWVDTLDVYKKAGITPTWISLQNEPDWKATWESCLWKPTEVRGDKESFAGYDKGLDAVYKRFQAIPNAPSIIGAEPTGIANSNMQFYVPPDNAKELSELGAVAHHMYNGGHETDPDSFLPALHAIRDSYPNKIKMQTEYGKGGWFNTAWLINNCMTEEDASAYIFWSGIWPRGEEALILTDNPWQKSSWKYPHGWKINDSYWAIKHFAFFTQPGWKRVAASAADPSLRVSAFMSPDGKKLTTILLNTSKDKAENVRLTAEPFAGQEGVLSRVYRTSENDPWHDLGKLPRNRTISLPPRSVATVVFL